MNQPLIKWHRVHTNFTTLKSLLHLPYSKDLIDDINMGGVLQAALGVASDILELISGDTEATKLADNVKKQLNAVWNMVSTSIFVVSLMVTYTLCAGGQAPCA